MSRYSKNTSTTTCFIYLCFWPFLLLFYVIDQIVKQCHKKLILDHARRITKNTYHPSIPFGTSIDTMSGEQFENWCAGVLQNNGFTNIRLTPGSGDQGVDILAEKDGRLFAVQCKRRSHALGNTPVQEVYTGMRIYKCEVGIVMTNNYFTESAKEAARATNVLLWDRDYISEKLMSISNNQ